MEGEDYHAARLAAAQHARAILKKFSFKFLKTKSGNKRRPSSHYEGSEGEHEPPNNHPSTPVDIFQEREEAGVGPEFQARIPPLIPLEDRNVEGENDKALLVWCPSDRLSEENIEEYLAVSKDKFHLSEEQALGLLYWHRYDVGKALDDLGNFTPQQPQQQNATASDSEGDDEDVVVIEF